MSHKTSFGWCARVCVCFAEIDGNWNFLCLDNTFLFNLFYKVTGIIILNAHKKFIPKYEDDRTEIKGSKLLQPKLTKPKYSNCIWRQSYRRYSYPFVHQFWHPVLLLPFLQQYLCSYQKPKLFFLKQKCKKINELRIFKPFSNVYMMGSVVRSLVSTPADCLWQLSMSNESNCTKSVPQRIERLLVLLMKLAAICPSNPYAAWIMQRCKTIE